MQIAVISPLLSLRRRLHLRRVSLPMSGPSLSWTLDLEQLLVRCVYIIMHACRLPQVVMTHNGIRVTGYDHTLTMESTGFDGRCDILLLLFLS